MARRKRKASGGGCGTLLVAAIALTYLADAGAGSWAGLVVLACIAAGAWLLWRWLAKPKTATARELAARLDAVTSVGGSSSGAHFEIVVADLLRAMGHSARVLGGSGDQGVDVIADHDGKRVAVQCKNYKKRVGNKPLQEVYAGARHHRCQEAWVVAPKGYTKGAQELAASTGVALFEESHLRRWIAGVDKAERARRGVVPPEEDSARTRGHCANCGSQTKPAQVFCTSCGVRAFETRAGA